MGASNSRAEEDKGLQLCRARKKFIKQALNGRCSLALAHIAYIDHLRAIGSTLSQFVDPNARDESFPCVPPTAIPNEVAHVRKPTDDHLSIPSQFLPSNFQSSAMKFGVPFSKKVEEIPPMLATITSTEASEATLPWDYFGIFHHSDEQISSQGRTGLDFEEEEEMPELEEVEEEESQASEDEFEEPPPASLIRSFRNVNAMENAVPETKNSILDDLRDKEDKPPDLSPLQDLSERDNADSVVDNNGEAEDAVKPKDFFSSIKSVEGLFVEASDSGKEVPQMLEANKFHFRLVTERGSITSLFLKSCFSCGKDPGEVQQEVPQSSVKYLTWHRTQSFRSASSQNPLLTNSTDEPDSILFDSSCMLSGSHASTLDRLYAWEKKLYDEVKAGQVLRTNFDSKCKILRRKESRGVTADKTRAAVKDLYSRIRVAIHRINSISNKIEEIRDSELQPQLEELIQGLRKMWETMFQCHKLQFHIMSASDISGDTKIPKTQPDTTDRLKNELDAISLAFTKWIAAQKMYVEAIDKWLFKCVALPQNPTRRNKKMKPPPIRNWGPPIYTMCGAWLHTIDRLPVQVVVESIHALAAEVARFGPSYQDKNIPRENGTHGDSGMSSLDQIRTALAGFLGQMENFAECCVQMFVELQTGIGEAKWNYQQFRSQKRGGSPSRVFVRGEVS